MNKRTPNSGKKPASRKKRLDAHVTHLVMEHPTGKSLPTPTRPSIALMRAKDIPVEFYRYIYELVGKPHHWEDRRSLDDYALDELINSPDCEIDVLYVDGCPAGFFELSKAGLPDEVELSHFGLGVDFQGFGIGKWFMLMAIKAAWAHKPARVITCTNTLDHPHALTLYQKLGFSPSAVSDVKISPWE